MHITLLLFSYVCRTTDRLPYKHPIPFSSR